MVTIRHLLAAACVLGGLCLVPGTARAAQSYDACTGFIDSVPTTITTQGVWCLRKDLATNNTSGEAIKIATNNVTIDCNDFKVGGLAAGDASQTIGIYAEDRKNVTVRNCNVRGFYEGINLEGGAGHLVEDNRLDNNLYTGISVIGDNNRVRRNAVYDTGGFPASAWSYGIVAAADVIDNTVAGVFATTTHTYPIGIVVRGYGNEARGNRVRGLAADAGAGILSYGAGTTIADNRISATNMNGATAIDGQGPNIFCTGNTVVNFSSAYRNCARSLNNLTLP